MKTVALTPALHDYLVAHGTPPDPVLTRLAARTGALGPVSAMQVAPEQGAFLTFLTRLVGATSALEVGTFTGYSALCIARGLAPGGRLLCCDVSADWTAIAREAWEEAGVADRIDLRLAPALDTLRALPADDTFGLAFIDADKTGYAAYLAEVRARLAPGGVIVVDNVLWGGRVIDPMAADADTSAIRAFNDGVVADPTLEVVMLAVADGLTLLREVGRDGT